MDHHNTGFIQTVYGCGQSNLGSNTILHFSNPLSVCFGLPVVPVGQALPFETVPLVLLQQACSVKPS